MQEKEDTVEYEGQPRSGLSGVNVWSVISFVTILLLLFIVQHYHGIGIIVIASFAFLSGLLGTWQSAKRSLGIFNILVGAIGLTVGLCYALGSIYMGLFFSLH